MRDGAQGMCILFLMCFEFKVGPGSSDFCFSDSLRGGYRSRSIGSALLYPALSIEK
jgi:hypothetical protein